MRNLVISLFLGFLSGSAYSLEPVFPTKNADLIKFGEKFTGVKQLIQNETACSSVKVAETKDRDIYLTALHCQHADSDPAAFPLVKKRPNTYIEYSQTSLWLFYASQTAGALLLGTLSFLSAKTPGQGYTRPTGAFVKAVVLSKIFAALYNHLFGIQAPNLIEDISLALGPKTKAPMYKIGTHPKLSTTIVSGVVVGFGGTAPVRKAGIVPDLYFDLDRSEYSAYDLKRDIPLQATIVSGDSGGGLFSVNKDGEFELIGINSGFLGPKGIGYIGNSLSELLKQNGQKPKIIMWSAISQKRLEELIKEALGDVKVTYHH